MLILDGLSLRELPLIVAAGQQRGLAPVRVEVRGAEVPTETDRFAEALGLPSRSKLYNNKAPGTFVFAGPDVYTDVLDAPFVDCVGAIPAKPAAVHLAQVARRAADPLARGQEGRPGRSSPHRRRSELSADGFWKLVDRLRQGRRLVITGDHGYADANTFSNEEKNEETVKLLRSFFGASPLRQGRPGQALAATALAPVGLPAQRLVGRHGPAQVGGPRRLSEPVSPGFVALGSGGSVHRISSQVDWRLRLGVRLMINMAKKQADPNQMVLPGVELDDQEKFDFAKPGGQAKKPRKSNGKANGDVDHLPPNLAKAGEGQGAGLSATPNDRRLAWKSIFPSCQSMPSPPWRATPASRSTR